MSPNRRTYETSRDQLEGAGYEKVISYKKLHNWIYEYKGGRKKRKTRKQVKSRKRKMKVKSRKQK